MLPKQNRTLEETHRMVLGRTRERSTNTAICARPFSPVSLQRKNYTSQHHHPVFVEGRSVSIWDEQKISWFSGHPKAAIDKSWNYDDSKEVNNPRAALELTFLGWTKNTHHTLSQDDWGSSFPASESLTIQGSQDHSTLSWESLNLEKNLLTQSAKSW